MAKKEYQGDLNNFKHKVSGRVKFAEVDSFGVAHNIQYLYWAEWARLEYFRTVSGKNANDFLFKEFPVMVVHSDVDYFSFAKFDEGYEILTRISFIKESSFGFENLVISTSGQILCRINAVMVSVDFSTLRPAVIPDFVRQMIIDFEGESLQIIEKTK